MTIDEVRELAAKGDDLVFEDFSGLTLEPVSYDILADEPTPPESQEAIYIWNILLSQDILPELVYLFQDISMSNSYLAVGKEQPDKVKSP